MSEERDYDFLCKASGHAYKDGVYSWDDVFNIALIREEDSGSLWGDFENPTLIKENKNGSFDYSVRIEIISTGSWFFDNDWPMDRLDLEKENQGDKYKPEKDKYISFTIRGVITINVDKNKHITIVAPNIKSPDEFSFDNEEDYDDDTDVDEYDETPAIIDYGISGDDFRLQDRENLSNLFHIKEVKEKLEKILNEVVFLDWEVVKK